MELPVHEFPTAFIASFYRARSTGRSAILWRSAQGSLGGCLTWWMQRVSTRPGLWHSINGCVALVIFIILAQSFPKSIWLAEKNYFLRRATVTSQSTLTGTLCADSEDGAGCLPQSVYSEEPELNVSPLTPPLLTLSPSIKTLHWEEQMITIWVRGSLNLPSCCL